MKARMARRYKSSARGISMVRDSFGDASVDIDSSHRKEMPPDVSQYLDGMQSLRSGGSRW